MWQVDNMITMRPLTSLSLLPLAALAGYFAAYNIPKYFARRRRFAVGSRVRVRGVAPVRSPPCDTDWTHMWICGDVEEI